MSVLNILFHGASVTQQQHDSYFNQLLMMFEKDQSFQFRKKGYGGCHLNDAGFLTIDFDSNEPTDICFLEWNTTGLDFFDEKKIRYIAGTLIKKRIVPVFLILARADSIIAERESERQIIKFCSENSITCLDYRSLINPAVDLRDVVHTNINGAIKYANQLFNDLLLLKVKLSDLVVSKFNFLEYSISAIRELLVDVKEGSSCTLEFSCIRDDAHVIIELIQGPSSAIVDINNGASSKQVWDQWCHFERPSFILFTHQFCNRVGDNGVVVLRVLPDKIDYSSCSREFDFDGVKDLKIRGVYGINCSPLKVSID